MKKLLLGLSILAQTVCGINAQQNTFRINYDVALFDIPVTTIESLTPTNYLFSGMHANFIPLVSSLSEIDATGTLVWGKRYSSGFAFTFGDVKKDPALNRYYACGGGETSGPAFLLFLDATGNVITARNFSIAEADGAYFNRVIKTSDGGYLCVGAVTGYDPDGAGPEVKFNAVTNNDGSCSSSHTEYIQSPLIVKFDASGNHVWHRVFRYYVTSATPANRIYNDASFVDLVEVSDGYIAIGNYDVNNVFSTFNGDCEDTTPTDAFFLKTTTAGAITYHRQIDNPSNSTGQSSKSLVSAEKTAAGEPLISGTDGSGRPCLLMRLPSSGAWANPPWSRKYGGGSIPIIGTYYPFIPSRFFEASDGNYALWLNYITLGLPSTFENVIMKVNPSTNATIWARRHVFNFASILPHGQAVSDGGYIGLSYTLAGTGHDMHFIKTDANGNASTDCPSTNLTVSNGDPGYTYGTPIYNSWNANTVTNGSFTPTVTNINPGSSVQCITVVTECTPPSAPTTVTATPNPICPGDNTTITASGPSDPNVIYNVYTASSGGTNLGATPLVVSPGTTTSYWIEAVNNSDPLCVSTTRTELVVTVNPAPTPANAGIDQSVCGTSATLNGNPPAVGTGQWTVISGSGAFGNATSPTSGVTGLSPGANVFQWTISNPPCTPSSDQVTITSVSAPTTANAGIDQSLCATSTALTGNAPTSGTGLWTVISGSGTFTDATNPTTTVTGLGTGANVFQWTISNPPCTASSDQVTITNTGGPTTANAGTDESVCGASATLNGNTPAVGTGQWTVISGSGTFANASSPTSGVTGLSPGANVFQWTISNPPCAPSSDQVTITSVSAPTTANAGIDQVLCASSTILAGNIATSGTGQWTVISGSGTFTDATNPTTTVTGLGIGANVFEWTISNPPCASSSDQVTITNTGGPSINLISIDDASCFGASDGIITVEGTGGVPGYTYSWSPAGGNSATTTPLPAGDYTVTVTDNVGCSDDLLVTINEPTELNLTMSSTPSSCAAADGTATVVANGGDGNYTYLWSPSGASTSTATNLAAGNHSVTVTDGNGCQANNNVTVTLSDGPVITVEAVNDVSCSGGNDGSVEISVTGGTGNYTYEWIPSGGNGAVASGLTAGSYTVTVTDDSGCEVNESVTIGSPTPISVIETITNAICTGEEGSISLAVSGGTGSYNYSWSPDGETTSSITGDAGDYSVTVTDSEGCEFQANYTIGLNNNLNATINPDGATISGGESVQLEVTLDPETANVTYTWTPSEGLSCTDCPNPIASPSETTTYTVVVLADNGCYDTAMVTVVVTTPCGKVFIPTIFSPNADGLNDELCILGDCIVEMDLRIYDRWGELVFESTVQNECWDGTFRGKPMNSAVFVYKLYVRTSDGMEIEESGNVNLVR